MRSVLGRRLFTDAGIAKVGVKGMSGVTAAAGIFETAACAVI